MPTGTWSFLAKPLTAYQLKFDASEFLFVGRNADKGPNVRNHDRGRADIPTPITPPFSLPRALAH